MLGSGSKHQLHKFLFPLLVSSNQLCLLHSSHRILLNLTLKLHKSHRSRNIVAMCMWCKYKWVGHTNTTGCSVVSNTCWEKWSEPVHGIGTTNSKDWYYQFKGLVPPLQRIGITTSKDRYYHFKGVVLPIQRSSITILRDRYYWLQAQVFQSQSSDPAPVTVLEEQCYQSWGLVLVRSMHHSNHLLPHMLYDK